MALRYELVVIDLDGTMLGRNGRVSERNRAALAEARAAGLEVIIATGRALIESLEPLRAVGHEGLVVAAGGSLLCDATSGRTIERCVMPHDLVVQITRSLMRHGHKALILKDPDATGYDYLAVGPAQLDPASQWWFKSLPVRVRFSEALEEDPHPHDTVRAGSVAQGDALAGIAAELRADLGDRALLQHWSAVTATEATGSSTHLLEIFNRQVSKWTMISAHCRRMGIDERAVVAIGDEINDVEMIRGAGLGIAMGNAVPAVKAVADRVTGDHDSDGLGQAIDHVLAGRW